jgi:hypothetical protein
MSLRENFALILVGVSWRCACSFSISQHSRLDHLNRTDEFKTLSLYMQNLENNLEVVPPPVKFLCTTFGRRDLQMYVSPVVSEPSQGHPIAPS